MSYYTLLRWGNIFQVLDVEVHHTLIMPLEEINIVKGEGVKT